MADENGNFDQPHGPPAFDLLKKVSRDRLRARNLVLLEKHLKPGDLLTHTRCCGILAEHRFTRWIILWKEDGPVKWLEGHATAHITRYCGERGISDDISPLNVTHLNRMPIADLDFCKTLKEDA